jgi:hypothetical protein
MIRSGNSAAEGAVAVAARALERMGGIDVLVNAVIESRRAKEVQSSC